MTGCVNSWCPQEFQIKISGHFQDISGQKFCFFRTIYTGEKPQRKSGSDTHLSTATMPKEFT